MPPIGIIPGGSGDALAKTLLFDSIEQFSIENAFWLIVKGQVKRVDLIEITNSSQEDKIFSFMGGSQGILADVDHESEIIRWAGDI